MPITEVTSSRAMLIELLHEIPADRIVFQSVPAMAMITHVEEGTETGLLFVADFFSRVRSFVNKHIGDT